MTHIHAEPNRTPDGQVITRYILQNDAGMTAVILDYGCTVQQLIVPDHSGAPTDVALGYDDLSAYERGSCFYGACVGRCANRIKDASFSLNGRLHRLAQNEGKNHLHGVFSRRVFSGRIEDDALILSRYCPSDEEGYPGNLTLTVRYRLTPDNALSIEYAASADEDTIINLTNHTYFNLNGQDGSDVLGHTLRISADRFTEIDGEKLPTGRILSVEGTPLDFRCEKKIGEDIFRDDPQLAFVRGYDHNLILNGAESELKEFAHAVGDRSGIHLTAYTTEPAVQLYTGNFIDVDPVPRGKNGICYPMRGGFCLEAQHYPDSPHHPHFPSIVLRRGETYRQTTVYRFST